MRSHRLRQSKYDIFVTVIPLLITLAIVSLLLLFPNESQNIVLVIRDVLGNQFGVYYLVLGAVFIGVSLFIAFSKYGKIRLGGDKCKPEYSTLNWAFMIFTSTMAADILFYSLHEWSYYWDINPLNSNTSGVFNQVVWSETYSLFHWGLTPWIFYILPAVAYAYMMHKKNVNRQKISEACRPVLGNKVDGPIGKIIDVVSVVALLLATSTTFSVATPLLSSVLSKITGINNSPALTIIVLMSIAAIFTIAVIIGFKGISFVSTACIVFFLSLVAIFLFNDNFRFIVENAVDSIGNLTQNFVRLSLWTDPLRSSGNGMSGVPQDWTVFYWAYWIAWSIATPFFIAKISKGRTVRQLIIGGTLSGVSCTFLSFSVFGGYGIAEKVKGVIEIADNPVDMIVEIINQTPVPILTYVILILAMVGFYTSTFDSITHVIASYSYKKIGVDEEPSKFSKIYWSVLFTLIPCTLLFLNSTSSVLQSISIIAAFPISILMIIVVIGFFKSVRSKKL